MRVFFGVLFLSDFVFHVRSIGVFSSYPSLHMFLLKKLLSHVVGTV